jgi:hypothetical protein
MMAIGSQRPSEDLSVKAGRSFGRASRLHSDNAKLQLRDNAKLQLRGTGNEAGASSPGEGESDCSCSRYN